MVNPEILWAQSRENIFITLNISNIIEQTINIDKELITFNGRNKENNYNIDIKLLKTINPEKSNWSVKANNVTFNLKKEPNVFWNKLSNDRHNNLRVDWNKWDIVEDSESEEEMGGMSYQKLNMLNNFKDFTKTLPSELMEQDLSDLFPGDELDDCKESNKCTSGCCGNSSLDDLNLENLDIEKLDEELINKMEEGRITRKDRESLSSNDGDLIENREFTIDETIPEN